MYFGDARNVISLQISFKSWSFPLSVYWDFGTLDVQVLCFYFMYHPKRLRQLARGTL